MELSNSSYGKGMRETYWNRFCRFMGDWWVVLLLASGAVWFVYLCVSIQVSEAASKKSWADRHQKAHSAWVKLTGRSDITLEEWKALKDSGVLNNK